MHLNDRNSGEDHFCYQLKCVILNLILTSKFPLDGSIFSLHNWANAYLWHLTPVCSKGKWLSLTNLEKANYTFFAGTTIKILNRNNIRIGEVGNNLGIIPLLPPLPLTCKHM